MTWLWVALGGTAAICGLAFIVEHHQRKREIRRRRPIVMGPDGGRLR